MRAAVVGCGQIADAHIQEARKAGATVVAVCDSNEHMAEQVSARLQVRGVYTDLDQMLDATRPDVVHVTTPPASHLPIGRTLIQRGIHAYVEKPFTTTAAEAEELVKEAEQEGILVCVGHNYAFDSPALRLGQAVADGTLGEPVHVEALMGYDLSGPFGAILMRDPSHWVHRLPGGLVQNNISHPLSLVLPFLPDPRPAVVARGWRWRAERFGDARDGFFDEVRVSLAGQNTTASVVFSCRIRPVQLRVTAYGTRAQGTASLDARTVRFVRGASLPGPFGRVQWAYRDSREARREAYRQAANVVRARLHFFEGMQELFRRFYAAVEGRGTMPIPMQEAVRVTRVMDDIFRDCRAHETTNP
jgi:predicted dehydrogenase